MATLIIKRSSEYVNGLRDIGIYLDGKKVTTLSNGAVTEISVPDGPYKFQAKIDWCSSQELLIDSNSSDPKTIFLSSFGYKHRFFTVVVICLALWYIVTAVMDLPPLLYIIPPIAVMSVLLYYITFGRHRYLVARDVTNV